MPLQIKSPLRYPGGKSRAIAQIAAYLPEHFTEFREPFVGGGSVFLFIRHQFPSVKVWINDLNFGLYCFWKEAQVNAAKLAQAVQVVKDTTQNGEELFFRFRDAETEKLTDFEQAVRFFVLNRITFSGTVESGGYSQQAFERRFTDSSIERLAALSEILEGVRITHSDYREVVREPSQSSFLFLDPPYYAATKSKLYGKKGILHTGFDHSAFAEEMQCCPYPWLITYDDSPAIRANFAFAQCAEWELQYGMNNYKPGKADKGKELFLLNYALPKFPHAVSQLSFADSL